MDLRADADLLAGEVFVVDVGLGGGVIADEDDIQARDQACVGEFFRFALQVEAELISERLSI